MKVTRQRFFWPFAFFVALYSLMRLAIFFMVLEGSIDPGRPIDPFVNAVIMWSQQAIGLAGLLGILGMVVRQRWGADLTVGTAVFTVLFDAWAVVQGFPTAAMGLVPAAVILLYVEAPNLRGLRAPAAQSP